MVSLNHRNDRNAHGGGLIAYFRSDIPHRRRRDYESRASNGVGFIIFDVIVLHEKWLFIGVYKPPPPRVHNDSLIESIINVFRQTQGAYRSTFLIGDINIDMLNTPKPFKDFMQICGLENIITEPTCFKSKKATLLDVVLTDTPRRIGGISNFDIGQSDFHNITCASTKYLFQKPLAPLFNIEAIQISTTLNSKEIWCKYLFMSRKCLMTFTTRLTLLINWLVMLLMNTPH